MRALIWMATAAGLLLWLLLGWAAFGLLDVAADWLVAVPPYLGFDPATSSAVAAAMAWLMPLGQGLLFLLFTIGGIAILAAPFALRRAASAGRSVLPAAARMLSRGVASRRLAARRWG